LGVVLLLDIDMFTGSGPGPVSRLVRRHRDEYSCQHFRKSLTKYGKYFLNGREFRGAKTLLWRDEQNQNG
jgi:hypothetical protein